MRTISLDLRERILAAYDHDEGTREQVAHRWRVSLGLVKKLLQQRRRTGDIAPRHRFSGRKPVILPVHQGHLRALLASQPGPDAARTAGGHRLGLHAAGHSLRAQKAGPDI